MILDSGDRTQFPTGAVRDMHEGKGRFDLLPMCVLMRLAKHFENGAKKYKERSWELGIPCHSFADSALRHLCKYMDGHTDEDHLIAAIWNLCGLAWTEEKKPELMDIPSRKGAEKMSGVELYLKFRQELDKICVPVILDTLECVEYIEYDGKTVGIVGGNVGYIDIVYVLPEYRRKGLAKKAVLEWYNRYKEKNVNTKLHIINNNIPALEFWENIFELSAIVRGEVDTLYEILSVKDGEDE